MHRALPVALLAALLAGAAPAPALAVDETMVLRLRAAAKDASAPLPQGIHRLTFTERLELADRLNRSTITLLLRQDFNGERTLPRALKEALETKAPGVVSRPNR